MPIKTDVIQIGNKPHFNMAGEFLYYLREPTNGTISERLARRLWRYALRRAEECGFEFLVNWTPEVSTNQGNEPTRDRFYSVSFYSGKGGRITLDGILINEKYAPDLDHGWAIAEDQYIDQE